MMKTMRTNTIMMILVEGVGGEVVEDHFKPWVPNMRGGAIWALEHREVTLKSLIFKI